MVGRVRLNHTESESAYEVRSVEAIFPDEETHSVSSSDLPMILTQAEARGSPSGGWPRRGWRATGRGSRWPRPT